MNIKDIFKKLLEEIYQKKFIRRNLLEKYFK